MKLIPIISVLSVIYITCSNDQSQKDLKEVKTKEGDRTGEKSEKCCDDSEKDSQNESSDDDKDSKRNAKRRSASKDQRESKSNNGASVSDQMTIVTFIGYILMTF